MQSDLSWDEIKILFARLRCFSMGTVDEDGTPRVSPIGSIFLGDEGRGHYFEHFPQAMRANLDRDPRLCIMAVNAGMGYWLKSLWRGEFSTHPALRLVAGAGPRREATEAELTAWLAKIRPFKRFKAYGPLWGGMRHVRDFTVLRVEPVGLGRLTP